MKDSTLLLRGRPEDATPEWVGPPVSAQGAEAPPWAAAHAAPPVSSDQNQTLWLRARRPPLLLPIAGAPQLDRLLAGVPALHGLAVDEARHRGLTRWLGEATPVTGHDVDDLLARALAAGEDRVAGPIVLAGQFRFRMDARERLSGAVAMNLAAGAEQPALRETIARARELLTSEAQDEAFAAAEAAIWTARGLPDPEQFRLVSLLERSALSARKLARSRLDGRPMLSLRAEIGLGDSTYEIDCVLDEAALGTSAVPPPFAGRALALLRVTDNPASWAPAVAHVLLLARRMPPPP